MSKPCEYCGCDLPVGVDKKTRQVRSHHFNICTSRPKKEVEESEEQKHFKLGYDAGVLETQLDQALKHKEWVGLTPDETYEFLHYATDKTWELVKSIEAKLKELNHD